MYTDIRISHSPLGSQLWSQRSRLRALGVNGAHLRWSRTDERERNRVRSGIAALQVSSCLVRRRRGVVLVSGKPVMMLRMIVIVVGVGVEQRHHAGRRNQRRDEQRCQGAMHNDESMRRRRAGQNDGERRAIYPTWTIPAIVPASAGDILTFYRSAPIVL